MPIPDIPEKLGRFEIPGRVTLQEGNGEMPKLEVTSDGASAEIYLHGAQVIDFRKKGDEPMLFLSQCSPFAEDKPIRGGIPLVFPWFGSREGMPGHGFARLADWELHEATTLPEGGVTLRFGLPRLSMMATFPKFLANYVVTVTDRLALELIITNASSDQAFNFETCLHSYFAIGDIGEIEITGLKGASYLDATENLAPRTESADAIRIDSEVDRIYYHTEAPVEIVDAKLRRKIRIEKTGGMSTVLWNPWLQKSQQIPDFGDGEYRQMVCVESGNVGPNRLNLPPGKTALLKVVLSSAPV